MKLFGWGSEESPISVAQAVVDRCQRKAADLCLQQQDAQRELAQAKQASIEQAMEYGHLTDDSLELASHTASVEILAAAVAKASADRADAEQQLAEAKDAEQRSKSVAEVEQLQANWREPADQLTDALAKLVPLARRGGVFALDMRQVAGLLEQWQAQWSKAQEIATVALTQYAAGIRSGAERADLPHTDEAKPAVTRVTG